MEERVTEHLQNKPHQNKDLKERGGGEIWKGTAGEGTGVPDWSKSRGGKPGSGSDVTLCYPDNRT